MADQKGNRAKTKKQAKVPHAEQMLTTDRKTRQKSMENAKVVSIKAPDSPSRDAPQPAGADSTRPIHLMSKAPTIGSVGPITTSQPVSTSAEDRERRLAEQRAITALKLQRKQRLGMLIHKRKTNLAYIKKVHLGNCYWLNVTMFSPDDISKYIATMVPKSRALHFFYFGLSVSRILALPPGLATVRACAQLLEEWEYFMSGAAMQSVKYFTSKTSPCVYPQTSPADSPAPLDLSRPTDLARPTLFRFGNAVVFEHLQVPHVAFELDYREVLLALCEALTSLYQKLQHEDCYNNPLVYETILKFDARMKHHVVNLVAKELTELANSKLRGQTQSLRSLMPAF